MFLPFWGSYTMYVGVQDVIWWFIVDFSCLICGMMAVQRDGLTIQLGKSSVRGCSRDYLEESWLRSFEMQTWQRSNWQSNASSEIRRTLPLHLATSSHFRSQSILILQPFLSQFFPSCCIATACCLITVFWWNHQFCFCFADISLIWNKAWLGQFPRS